MKMYTHRQFGLPLTLGLGLAMLAGGALAQSQQDPQPDQGRKAQFEALDTDGSGSISYEEFAVGDMDRFNENDIDGDGLLSMEEMLAAAPRPRFGGGAAMRDRIAERVTEQFTSMDSDGDDFVSRIEASEATFLRMDADGNGLLSMEEMKPPRPEGRGKGRRGDRRGSGSRPGTAADS